MKRIEIQWLDDYSIYYDKLIFSTKDKLDFIVDNKIDIMIEDDPKNIRTISNVIPVICYNANYNKLCEGNYIIRCYSWYDIYNIIKGIEASEIR